MVESGRFHKRELDATWCRRFEANRPPSDPFRWMKSGVVDIHPPDLMPALTGTHINRYIPAVREIYSVKVARARETVRLIFFPVCQKVVSRLGRENIEC